MESLNFALVIPTYNEKENIVPLMEEVHRTCSLNALNPEFFIIDDNSPDGTADAAEEAAGRFRVSVIRRKGRRGLGLSYREGFQSVLNASDSEFIFSMDADFSHDPCDIPAILNNIRSNDWDIAIGSRYAPGGSIPHWSPGRRIVSGSCNALFRLILGLHPRDVTTAFRCYRRRVIESLPWNSFRCDGYAFMEEIIFYCEKLGFSSGEVPVTYRRRIRGETKLNGLEIAKVFITLMRLRFTVKNVDRGKLPLADTQEQA